MANSTTNGRHIISRRNRRTWRTGFYDYDGISFSADDYIHVINYLIVLLSPVPFSLSLCNPLFALYQPSSHCMVNPCRTYFLLMFCSSVSLSLCLTGFSSRSSFLFTLAPSIEHANVAAKSKKGVYLLSCEFCGLPCPCTPGHRLLSLHLSLPS